MPWQRLDRLELKGMGPWGALIKDEVKQVVTTEVEATELEGTEAEMTAVQTTEVEATEVEATEVEATEAEETEVEVIVVWAVCLTSGAFHSLAEWSCCPSPSSLNL